ncbi:GPCR fungal pheromone mating factor [Cytidiella melzeri]|nr:GPCR fungal pheromone mating factor [Cytidiella melzeri]
MHPEFPYVAFIAATLVLVPFPWHWRAGNVATIMIMLWLFAVNVIYGVDAIIWRHNVDVRMAIWCDITTKIIIAANIALPAACMCVCIHLESVASVRHVRSSLADKRRRQFFDGFFCFFLPVVWMAVHYVVQGHRFDIIEEFGCRPSIYMSIPAIFLIWVPPFLFAVVTFVFAALALVHFFRRRITFAKHLESRSGLSPSRYMRLILMAVFEIVFAVTSTSVTLWVATLDIRPWTNWDDIHFNFSRVDQYPSLYISSFVERYYTAIWWIIPLSSAMFFVFFAFGQEAIRDYKAVFSGIREKIFKLRSPAVQVFTIDEEIFAQDGVI